VEPLVPEGRASPELAEVSQHDTAPADAPVGSDVAKDQDLDDLEDKAQPVLRSSGSSIGISEYRLKSPEPEPAATTRRIDLTNYQLKDTLLHRMSTEDDANVNLAGSRPLLTDIVSDDTADPDELDLMLQVCAAISTQFDLEKTPRLAAAIDAVLAELTATDVFASGKRSAQG
jgi:hypothetical protein